METMTESVGEVLSTHSQSSRKDLAALMASKGFSIYPTVPQQLHPLRVESIRPGEGSHNDLVAVSLEGHVDVEALTKAVQLLVQGHEALRTFFTHPPTPHMVVAERLDPPFRHVVGCSPDEARSIAVSMLRRPPTRSSRVASTNARLSVSPKTSMFSSSDFTISFRTVIRMGYISVIFLTFIGR